MKKIIILFILFLMLVPSTYAQGRGPLSNVFASWYSVTAAETKIVLPGNSRDVFIQNGSAVEIFVDLRGGSIGGTAINKGTDLPHILKLDVASSITLSDFITDSLSLYSQGGTASPVSVIVTY